MATHLAIYLLPAFLSMQSPQDSHGAAVAGEVMPPHEGVIAWCCHPHHWRTLLSLFLVPLYLAPHLEKMSAVTMARIIFKSSKFDPNINFSRSLFEVLACEVYFITGHTAHSKNMQIFVPLRTGTMYNVQVYFEVQFVR